MYHGGAVGSEDFTELTGLSEIRKIYQIHTKPNPNAYQSGYAINGNNRFFLFIGSHHNQGPSKADLFI
jgi:hypothetical protein